ncbi:hypothetical protein JRQ81_003874 [Phrynocephalus forsythii]|uniref:Uncharacterized protein n=1 Tax=Phrynocephalus forsythii TaxID=171643 RepID=A0A9Q0XNV5_9SAUR|nr:hypothetical protein JRQ81_003874 [Phrynocephalus forsythii]
MGSCIKIEEMNAHSTEEPPKVLCAGERRGVTMSFSKGEVANLQICRSLNASSRKGAVCLYGRRTWKITRQNLCSKQAEWMGMAALRKKMADHVLPPWG